MDDRVAEVLGERAALGSGAAAGIAASILLHAALTAAAILGALRGSTPQSAGTMTIQFANAITAPAAKPQPTPRLAEPTPVVEKPAAKPEPKTVPLSNFGQSTKKGSESPATPPPRNPATQQPSHPATASATATTTAPAVTIEGDFPYTIYIERMKTLVGTHWIRPQSVAAITSTVSFRIDRDGSIREARTETPSGNVTFDNAALRAVLEASPLPPLPFGYNGSWLGVHLTFR
jgi:TonB family protein